MNLSTEWNMIRIAKNESWLSVAKRLDCGRKTLYSMINSNNPTVGTLEKLGFALDVDYIDVLNSAKIRHKRAEDSSFSVESLGLLKKGV